MGKYAMKVAVDSIVTNETIDFYHFKTTRVNCTAIDPSQVSLHTFASKQTIKSRLQVPGSFKFIFQSFQSIIF